MIVPFSKRDQAQGPQAQKVTEAELLMALATMHSQGKLAGEAVREGSGPQVADLATVRRLLDKGQPQEAIDRADSDADIRRIRREMERRGLDVSNPQLDIGPR